MPLGDILIYFLGIFFLRQVFMIIPQEHSGDSKKHSRGGLHKEKNTHEAIYKKLNSLISQM